MNNLRTVSTIPFIFLLSIVCLFSAKNSLGQNAACGTSIDEQLSTYSHIKDKVNWPRGSHQPGRYIVPLKFHIIGANNGAFAIDSFKVFEELARVNLLYASANIEFRHCGLINYINSTPHLTFIKTTDEGLCDMHDVEDAINIYFAPNVERPDGSGICGYAYNYDIKQRIVMDNGCSTNGSTLAHELGHSFSLLHTHSTTFGRELVNGSNCAGAGDFLCDTPADPKLSSTIVTSNCVYTGTDLDPQSQAYLPDVNNIMSYSRKSCRTHFSQEQLEQIESYHIIFQDRLFCVVDTISATSNHLTLSITIWPNPVEELLTIANITTPSTVKLFDINGKLIFTTQLDHCTNSHQLSMQGVSSGLYYLAVEQKNNVEVERIIKL